MGNIYRDRRSDQGAPGGTTLPLGGAYRVPHVNAAGAAYRDADALRFFYDTSFLAGLRIQIDHASAITYVDVVNATGGPAHLRAQASGDALLHVLRTGGQGYAFGVDDSVSGRPLVASGNDAAGGPAALGTNDLMRLWLHNGANPARGAEFIGGIGWPHILVSDADRTLTLLECSVTVAGMTTNRAVTLPLIADLPCNKIVWIKKGVDDGGARVLTITPAATNTVQSGSGSITTNGNSVLLFGDKGNGSTEWQSLRT